MKLFSKSSLYILYFFLFLGSICITVYYQIINESAPKLPIYLPKEINPELVDPSVDKTSKNHTISNFKFVNQEGEEITQNEYEGKIYVADFFFTTCTNICIPMSKNMKSLQDEFENDDEVMFLSHTVMPEVDSVETLKKYADKLDVNSSKWNIVTGDKKHIYELARKSYFAVTTEGDGGVNDFIHTQNFLLIDKERRIRGFYDGTKPSDIKKIIRDIKTLKKEYR